MGERRRRGKYSDELKRAVVAETFEQGVSVASIARRHGLTNNLLFMWRKDPRYQPDAQTVGAPGAAEPSNIFLPLTIDQAVAAPADGRDTQGLRAAVPSVTPPAHPTVASLPNGQITIELGRSTRLTLDGGFDPVAVGALIRTLRAKS